MRAGSLNTWVSIQRPTVGPDSEGSPRTIWSVLARVPAKIEALSAAERIAAAQAQLDVTDQVTIRYRVQRDVTHNMRLLLDDRVLEIREVISDEKRRTNPELRLICQEIQV